MVEKITRIAHAIVRLMISMLLFVSALCLFVGFLTGNNVYLFIGFAALVVAIFEVVFL